MAMTLTGPRRGNRRWIYLGLVLIGLGVAAYYGIVGGLKNCRWLDRLLGISGCVASHRVTGLQLGNGWHLAAPPGGDILVFVGEEPRPFDSKPVTSVLVVLDALTGAERLRTVVARTNRSVDAVNSADGQRIALVCSGAVPCFENGAYAVIVAARDGKSLEALQPNADTRYRRRFPTEPAPPPWADGAVVLPGGALLLGRFDQERNGKIEIRNLADRSIVRALRTEDGDFLVRNDPHAIAISPSGRMVAILAYTPTSGYATLLSVFDIASGKRVTSFTTKDSIGTALVWAGKEDRLVVVRAVNSPTVKDYDSTDMRFDIYAVPKS
jgi:hypothetical protein